MFDNLMSRLKKPTEFSLLLISTFLAVFLLLCRIYIAGSIRYQFLVWNLFLAWIPYLVAVWMTKNERPDKAFLIGGLAIWLLFFPNAPYIVTDFLHYSSSHHSRHFGRWFDILLLFSFSWVGLLLGFSSLRKLQINYFNQLKEFWARALIGIILGLTSFGVYLGRYLRWNSWDIIADPIGLIEDVCDLIFHPIQNLDSTLFTLCFSLFLLIGYLGYCSREGQANHK